MLQLSEKKMSNEYVVSIWTVKGFELEFIFEKGISLPGPDFEEHIDVLSTIIKASIVIQEIAHHYT